MSDTIRRHDLLESIRPAVEQLDIEGLDILQGWVQELKVARIRQSAEGELPPSGGGDPREEFRELLRRWESIE